MLFENLHMCSLAVYEVWVPFYTNALWKIHIAKNCQIYYEFFMPNQDK